MIILQVSVQIGTYLKLPNRTGFGKITTTTKIIMKCVQVVNSIWDRHNLSYDLVVLFTGKMDFKDGDGNLAKENKNPNSK